MGLQSNIKSQIELINVFSLLIVIVVVEFFLLFSFSFKKYINEMRENFLKQQQQQQ